MRVRLLCEAVGVEPEDLEPGVDWREFLGQNSVGRAIFWAYSRAHIEEHRNLTESDGRVTGRGQAVVAHLHPKESAAGPIPCNVGCELWDWSPEETLDSGLVVSG